MAESFETEAAIQRALNGDQTAFKALYDHYAAGIYRLCYSLVLNKRGTGIIFICV